MSAPITLPGAIPGLLRRGSPVVVLTAAGPARGLYLGPDYERADEHEIVWLPLEGMTGHTIDPLALSDLDLDLTDATGRAHAAWWLDMRTRGVPLGHAALCEQPEWWDRDGRCSHPALADLDPDDPRLLPDGSRRIDAEALRRVVLHVAGVSP